MCCRTPLGSFARCSKLRLTRVSNMSEMSDRLLEWCKMIDRRLWQSQHVLRHFCYPPTTMSVMKGLSLDDGPKGGVLKDRFSRFVHLFSLSSLCIASLALFLRKHHNGNPSWCPRTDEVMSSPRVTKATPLLRRKHTAKRSNEIDWYSTASLLGDSHI